MEISLIKFLSRFYGINLDAGCKYSHADIKKNFEFVKRCSYQHADKNSDMVFEGEIIYVRDSYNLVVPYVCPSEVMIASEDCLCTKENFSEDSISSIMDLLCSYIECLSDYELFNLMHKYKFKPSIYRLIKKELIKRGVYDNKIYKINKEVVDSELKECDFDDKYQRRRKIKRKKS